MGKSRVAPLKTLTIPHLKLAAEVVSVNVSATLRRELDYEITSETFWTDSEVTLGYVSNESKKFHVFVANRVQHIRDETEPCQWRHVSGDKNPADEALQGLTPQQLLTSALWIKGPSLLWESKLPNARVDVDIKDDDPEVKQSRTMSVAGQTVPQFNAARLERFSSWFKVRAAVGVCLRYQDKLLAKVKGRDTAPDVSCVQNLQEAETVIIKAVQAEAFKEEIRTLKIIKASESSIQDRNNARNRNVALKRTSSLYRMDPFLDKYGVLRVGGRIRQAQVDIQMKHPVILPKNSHITSLILHHCHEMVHHGGRSATINSVCQQGYWAIGCRGAVSSLIGKCVRCQRLRTKPQSQKMADLPVDRLEPAPCFTYCGTDVFGPWYVKEGRSQVKHYGLIFTCLVMRAVHLETINSMTTDSFINALRRLIAVRGTIKLLRCDCGTNFVGANNELSRAWKEMDFEVIRKFLLQEECDIEFRFNVPSASNRGGVWECQIRSVRTILMSMLLNSGTQLDDESLRTLMYEVMAIINGRPLTTDDLEDPTSLLPLTPNQLLTMKSRVIVPPPGNFPKEDLMLRKRWCRVQYLANIFWTRWRKEYLHILQARQKWTSVRDNIAVGDIVTLKEDETTPRNLWRLA